MAVKKEKKVEIIQNNKQNDKDTGSPEVQIALYTERIKKLTEHFRNHKQDHNSRVGLIKLVSARKKMLEYLRKKDPKRYASIIQKLGLRK